MTKVRVWSEKGKKHVDIYMADSQLIPYFMSGRVVFLYPTNKNLKCADCGRQAKYIVIESELQNEFWAWCGICDVGG